LVIKLLERKEMDLSGNKKKVRRPVIKLFNNFNNHLLKITLLMLLFLLCFSALLLISGCKKQASSETPAKSASSIASESLKESLTAAPGSSSATTESSTVTQADKESAAQTAAESATESTETIPSDITDLIKEADEYYASGQYGLSKSTYRKAIIAIDASDLSDDAKQQLKDSIQDKYNKSKTIIETALMHFGNAMQLEYETRYEEAKSELEAALAIYPKYADALEAYENLKSIMGLE
jgi:tetratricopeptide (TPR) repeat protein